MTWMLGPEERTGYRSTAEQGATTSWMVRDNARSGSPTTVSTGSGVATVSTDGHSGTGKVLNNAICAMCGAIRSRVAAMTGATTRLGQTAWMPKPDECMMVKAPVVGSLRVQQPWWRL